jgi:hypothetical protein
MPFFNNTLKVVPLLLPNWELVPAVAITISFVAENVKYLTKKHAHAMRKAFMDYAESNASRY